MSLKLCTLNVKGIASKQKRLQVFEWLKQNKYNICLLQEAHCTINNHKQWSNEWKDNIFLRGDKSKSLGIGILFNGLQSQSFQHTYIIPGRLQSL